MASIYEPRDLPDVTGTHYNDLFLSFNFIYLFILVTLINCYVYLMSLLYANIRLGKY